MCQLSRNIEIRDNSPEILTYRKWKGEVTVDIIGNAQVGRSEIDTGKYTSFCSSTNKQKSDARIKETRQVDQKKRYAHLVQCSHEGKCLRWAG